MNLLEKLDEFFDTQKDIEQRIIFSSVVLIIFFSVYYFLFPIINEKYQTTFYENIELKNKIAIEKDKIFNLKNSIAKNRYKQKQLEVSIKKLNKVKIVVNNLLKKVRFLSFNLHKWAEIYNQIPKYVKNTNLTLLELNNNLFLNNKKNKNNHLINLKMQIKLKVVGDFRNVVKIMNIFERRKELVKIVFFNSNGVISNIVINIYGAEL